MNFTPNFQKSLNAEDIQLGQLLYAKHGRDCREWVVQDIFRRGIFGDWAVRIVSATDLTGPTYTAWLNELTDQPVVPTALHPQQRGTIIYTANGTQLKVISRGMA